jgi:NADH-quinone oxidoreductase subunit N
VPEYFALLLFSVFGMMVLTMSNELITLFICLEIASMSTYIMITLNKTEIRPVEAMMKYLAIGSVAGAIYLFGVMLIFASAGTTNLGELGAIISGANMSVNMLPIIIGGSMVLILILFKINAVPFHAWSLDVYTGAPFPVTAYLMSTFKLAVFVIAIRIFLVDFVSIANYWSTILTAIIVVTFIVGTLLAVTQNNVKRMLIASGVVQAGYVLMGFVSATLTQGGATPAIIFYLVSYFVASVGVFGFLSYIVWDSNKTTNFDDFKGFAHKRPIMAVVMTIFMLSYVGFPSTIGFMAKLYIFSETIKAGLVWLAVLGVMATFVSVYYYLRLIAVMYFYPSQTSYEEHNGSKLAPFILVLIALTILLGGISNSWLIDIVRTAYESL